MVSCAIWHTASGRNWGCLSGYFEAGGGSWGCVIFAFSSNWSDVCRAANTVMSIVFLPWSFTVHISGCMTNIVKTCRTLYNACIVYVCVFRSSPCAVRRAPMPYREGKPHGNRLSVGPRSQHRQSPRVPNGDRAKPPKGKEKKENASRQKEDKVRMGDL